jgi:hypothetical protein
VSDRIEAQYAVTEGEQYSSASDSAAAGLEVAWRQTSLRLGYSPRFTLTPLDKPDRELIIFHNGALSASYRFRHTNLELSQTVGYGRVNFEERALGAQDQTAPQPGTGTPTDGGTTPNGNAAPAGNDAAAGGPTQGTEIAGQSPDAGVTRTIAFNSFHSSASLQHQFSRAVTFRSGVGYTIAGGADRASRREYGLSRGPSAEAGVAYALDIRNSIGTSLSATLIYPQGGNALLLVRLSENYAHAFTRKTQGSFGLGISYSREEQPNGSQINGIYPTAFASLGSSERLARGTLSFGATASAAPVLDMSTVNARLGEAQAASSPIIDPRLTLGLGAGWSRDSFSLHLGAGTSITLRPGEPSSLNSVAASAGFGYDLGAGFSFDMGVRGAWQTLAGATVVPPSGGVYAGLSWGDSVALR